MRGAKKLNSNTTNQLASSSVIRNDQRKCNVHSGRTKWNWRRFPCLCFVLLEVSFTCGCSERPRELENAAPAHRLVILVPGTFANRPDWARTDVAGKTLAKELLQQLNPGDSVVPFWWSGGLSHSDRVDAARKLARLVDETRSSGDRIFLLGHSHGGNVCLLAASFLEEPMDAVICMGTPHIYLHHSGKHAGTTELPVYCLPQTLENAGRIICISDTDDRVAEELSNAFLTGISDVEAASSVEAWRSVPELNLEDPKRVRLTERLFESDCVFASRVLSLADEQIQIDSDRARLLGISAHTRLRSPEIATCIADVIKTCKQHSR